MVHNMHGQCDTPPYRRPLVLPLHGGRAPLRPLPQPVVHAQAAEEAAEERKPDEEGDEGGVAQEHLGLLLLEVVQALLPRPLEVREGCCGLWMGGRVSRGLLIS